ADILSNLSLVILRVISSTEFIISNTLIFSTFLITNVFALVFFRFATVVLIESECVFCAVFGVQWTCESECSNI
ncbi:hypothetical protein L9F63_021488, partial [Diploptera punctata]